MNATAIAVALSLVSAAAYASAAVAQARLAGRTEPDAGVLRLLGRGAWWSAVALNAGGALLHVAALKYGPLTLVQPLGALTLVAAGPVTAGPAGGEPTPGAGSPPRVVIASRGPMDQPALRPEPGRAPVVGS